MFKYLIHKVIGTKNERELKRLQPRVGEINVLEPAMQQLSEADLKALLDPAQLTRGGIKGGTSGGG